MMKFFPKIYHSANALEINRRFLLILVTFILSSMLLIPIFSFTIANAQDIDLTEMSLEELMEVRIKPVVSASKYEQKTTDAPASVSIITADDIKQYGYRTLAEVLQSVRGFYITYDRNYNNIGFRGFNRPGDFSSRTLLLLDGIRVNDNIFDQAPVGTDFILDIDLIERIEIIRGPSYALYGNNAFLVVINVITKNGGEISGVEAGADIGSFGTYSSRLTYGKKFENEGQLLLSGSLFNSDGQSHYYREFDTPDQNNGVADNCDSDKSGSFFAKYSQQGVTFETSYNKRSKQIPTSPWGISFNDPRNKTWDERALMDIKLERSIDNEVTVMARLTYGYYKYLGDYIFSDSGDKTTNSDNDNGQWWGADLHFTRKFGKHMLIAGGEYHDNFTQYQKNFDVPNIVYLDDNRNSTNWAVFIQDEYSLLTNLKLNAGLRYDHFSTFGGITNPRFAIIYKPFADTSLKYLFGKAFRAPNVYETYYNDGNVSQKANPELNEETITSHELVWEQLIGKHLTGTATAYRYKINDLISQTTDTDDLLIYKNHDVVEAYGIEAELSASFSNGFSGKLSYAFQESDYKGGNNVWSNSPRHLAKLNISIPLIQNRLFLGIEEQYTGQLETLSGSSTGDYFITNMTLYDRKLFENMDISASVYNLFDKKYGFPGCAEHAQDVIEQDGISFRAKLIYRF